MKKVEIDRQVYEYPDGKKVIWVMREWRFTEQEKDRIREILKHEDPIDSIEHFISHLEFFCDGKKWLQKNPPKADLRYTRERILSDCKATLDHLKQIGRGKVALWTHDTLKDYGAGQETRVTDYLLEEHRIALKAIGPLQKFIETLENHHRAEGKKRGRPSADADAFITKLAEIYAEHIGKPSSYEDGPFFALVQTILEILKLPCEDPSRAIREALSHQ
jgi:hypothetical protein